MRCLTLFSLFLSLSAHAAADGPPEVALADQSLWPAAIQDHQGYDAASRAEILLFLEAYGARAEAPLAKGNEASLRAWRDRSARYWLQAYLDSAKDCREGAPGCGFTGKTFPELLAYAAAFPTRLPKDYGPWLAMSRKFFSVYLDEQKRLAGLFPQPTSEILPVADSEVLGDRFRDGDFLLTFDDGPTPAGGDTDKTADLVRGAGISAQFFALGDMLQPRIDQSSLRSVTKLYDRVCLGSHGYHHLSHQKWADWKKSIHDNWSLIQRLFPASSVPFRPPYGQRTAALVAEQEKMAGAPVVLWNIDSEDWNDLMPTDKVGDRVQKLMLLWRKGVILMHDVHPKAQVAVPQLVKFAHAAGLTWADCHQLK